MATRTCSICSSVTEVDKGTLLTLILSKGKQPVAIPDLKGQPLEQAKQKLQQAGLTPGDEVKQPSTTIPDGSVITTRPDAGTLQDPTNPVTLLISTGMQMPNLVGMPQDQAAQALAKLGLNVQWQEQDPADGQQPNTVVAQNPPVGTTLTPGQAVQVTVTKGVAHCHGWNPFCKHGDNGNNGGNGNNG
ncbi:MAG: PASTA domain-containing protein [Actinoallomurus sp.]